MGGIARDIAEVMYSHKKSRIHPWGECGVAVEDCISAIQLK